jgi:hypothetical protein
LAELLRPFASGSSVSFRHFLPEMFPRPTRSNVGDVSSLSPPLITSESLSFKIPRRWFHRSRRLNRPHSRLSSSSRVRKACCSLRTFCAQKSRNSRGKTYLITEKVSQLFKALKRMRGRRSRGPKP